MFKLSYDQPSEFAGTIRGKVPQSLGSYWDAAGNKWDIRGIFGTKDGTWVQAVPESALHPYYTDTSGMGGYGLVQQTWKPYRIEVIDADVVDTADTTTR
jgi:hypothetical protein